VPLLVAALGVVVLLAACRSTSRDRVRLGWTERGQASWYGFPFHGQRTASGERFDMNMMTAAHRELPMGTVVEVRNLVNDRRVQVRINDRGPFVHGRILDLSFAAATELDMVRTGTTEIELRVVEMGALPPSPTAVLTVQVGAFQDRERADALLARLARDFGDARIEESLPWFRVRVGTFADVGAARELQARLLRKGFRSIVTRAGLGPVLSEDEN
jgi:peptidoglycan lytic transglycosylase